MTSWEYLLALASTCVIATLSACDNISSDDLARTGAEAAVRQSLKDPSSAQFGQFYYNKATGRACLGVNAKNAFGGYVGEKQAGLVTDGKDWAYSASVDISHEQCRSQFADKTA
jgi:hypothetical protein